MNNRGFTLIEVLISLVIITLLILALNKVIYTVKKANINSQNTFQASIYGQNIIEYLKSSSTNLNEGQFSPDELLKGDIGAFIKRDIVFVKFSTSIIKINKIYEKTGSSGDLFQVEILIIWEGASNEKNYKIGTYIYK
mgnify:CR=1 FL=1